MEEKALTGTPVEADVTATDEPAKLPETESGRTRRAVWRNLRRSQFVLVALLLFLALLFVAVAAPWVAPYDPAHAELLSRLQPPGFQNDEGKRFLLGTDTLGRDMLSRLIYGARISLTVGLTTVTISGILGVTLGLAAGFYGGALDAVLMRLADIQLAFPNILLYIAVLAVLGPGLEKVIVILGITGWVVFARVTRGEVLSIRENEYVMAARAIGCSDRRILFRHILPNSIPAIIVIASFAVANNIIIEASLSFLGLGVPSSIPSWGAMLAESRDYLRDAWWAVTLPGLAIMITVLTINTIGDWFRDLLDPQLTHS